MFEVAIGMNGAVWLSARSPRETVLVRSALLNAAHMDDAHALALVEKLAEHLGDRRN